MADVTLPKIPEKTFRQIQKIPRRPVGIFKSIAAEIGRHSISPELQTLLEHMIRDVDDQLDTAWKAIDVLDKRFIALETEATADIDLNFTEQSRTTSSLIRKVFADDLSVEFTFVDLVTDGMVLTSNGGQTITFSFTPTL